MFPSNNDFEPTMRKAQICAYCKIGQHAKCTGPKAIFKCDCRSAIHLFFAPQGEKRRDEEE